MKRISILPTASRTDPAGRLFAAIAFVWLLGLAMQTAARVTAQDSVPAVHAGESQTAVAPEATDNVQRRHAMIIVGLPGDEEHRRRFETTIQVWQDWMVKSANVAPEDITILAGREATAERLPATQENIRSVTQQLVETVAADESLWVFFLGHGNQDQRHAWFHVPGPDMNEAQWAGMFAEVRAREQVFWLTHSASGRFLKAFSLPDRIVITATDDGEINETRFPSQLVNVMTQQLEQSLTTLPDDPSVSVLELFLRTSDQVSRSFDEDDLLPTEHALLDDNGDGRGTEAPELSAANALSANTGAAQAVIDGLLAARTIIATPQPQPTPDDSVAPAATQQP